VLSEHHILSAPVQDPSTAKFTGLIDMVDIMSGIIKCVRARVSLSLSRR
jgi:predicted transcriptional regulator